MDADLLRLAMAINENAESAPEYVDDEEVYFVVSELSASVYEAFARANDESAPETLGVEEFAAYIPNAIAAAYIAGLIQANETNPRGLTIPGKQGAIYNFYFS